MHDLNMLLKRNEICGCSGEVSPEQLLYIGNLAERCDKGAEGMKNCCDFRKLRKIIDFK